MNYTKPEVTVLGQAVGVIENRIGKLGSTFTDGPNGPKVVPPAYDLDE